MRQSGYKSSFQVIALTTLAMLAFAANSLLCRLALRQEAIDPASFSSIRLVCGALTLAVMLRFRVQPSQPVRADWPAAAMLLAYMVFFSFAYSSLSAGTGALILFGAVQLTMFGMGLRSRERFTPLAWIGLAMAVSGLVYLLSPGVAAPPLSGAMLMAMALTPRLTVATAAISAALHWC